MRELRQTESAYYIAGRMQSPKKDFIEEGLGVGEVGRDAGGGDGFVAVDARDDVEVEIQGLLLGGLSH